MNTAQYKINLRKAGTTTYLSVTNTRGDVSVRSAEKALPPVIEYDGLSYNIQGPQAILQGIRTHPYKPNSPEFSADRLADLEVSQLFAQLEHFPTLPSEPEDGSGRQMEPHPVAEHLYSNMVYLAPTDELHQQLRRAGYIQRTKSWPVALQLTQDMVQAEKGISLDLHAVPKRKVGTFCYLADPKDGFARAAKTFSFGFHRAIPNDRLARELSSLKAAERFLNPTDLPFEIEDRFKPYVTMVRFAIVATEFSMLDGVDLYPSCVPKIACRLVRERVVQDVYTIPPPERQLSYRPFRAGVEVVHRTFDEVDETLVEPGTIRMVLPGGVKVAAQLQSDQQMYDEQGKPIDAMVDYRTFAAKGALALFAMLDPLNFTRIRDIENDPKYTTEAERSAAAWSLVENAYRSLVPQKVTIDGMEYEAYVGELPVMRPGQRYTELSKPSNDITSDLIARAILGEDYKVRSRVEKEYAECRAFRKGLERELQEANS